MSTVKICIITLFGWMLITGNACKKYLDAKPDKQLVIPAKVEDLQALLDYNSKVNEKDPSAGEVSSDNYSLTDANWNALAEEYRRMYTWEKDHVFPPWPNQWSTAYDAVFIANSVLDNLQKVNVNAGNQANWNSVKGQALYHRAREFLQIAFVWTLGYDAAPAPVYAGIPLRLSSDFNELSVRSTLQQTYDKIIADLKETIPLLPVTQVSPLRPSKPAAYGLLARVYLSMRQYATAGLYADSALQLNSNLLDYNTLNPAVARPIARFNKEVVMESFAPNPTPLSNDRARIDSNLYASYAAEDLRKTVLFTTISTGVYGFKGNYSGNSGCFTGVANNEVYLMRAECYARAGNTTAAVSDLNTLLVTRWKKGFFTPFTASTAQAALELILTERRKELLYRGLRWMDIKRLNKEGANIVLKRTINGQTYTLPPNDLRYAIAIPEDVISLSGMSQNSR